MRRFVILPLVLICVSATFAGVSEAAPEWTHRVGLDFWNLGEEQTRLETIQEQIHASESQREAAQRRAVVVDHIALELCENEQTLSEAIDEVLSLAANDPDWFAHLNEYYRTQGFVPATATEREVVTCYLLTKIGGMQWTAEQAGDLTRSEFIALRLEELDEESHTAANTN